MPIQTVIDIPGEFTWIDCFEPKPDELNSLAARFQLPEHMVEDALRPEHLPKFEKTGNTLFFIFRAFDENVRSTSVTVQQITRKIAFFIGDKFILTIHRVDQSFFKALKTEMANTYQSTACLKKDILVEILNAIFSSYEKPLERSFGELEHFESVIFNARRPRRASLRRGYLLKRKSSVQKRILKLSLDVLNRAGVFLNLDPARLQETREHIESLFYYADDLEEQVTSLLNLHLSLASQYTNEVVRVLTVFSIFFLPLNFIAGVYGMNFEHMPELKWEYGYFAILGVMTAVGLFIYTWFRRKGWLNTKK